MKINIAGADWGYEGYTYVKNSWIKYLGSNYDPQAEITVVCDIPKNLKRYSPYSIAFTMTEGTVLPTELVRNVNMMNACFVPNKQCLQAFVESGVTVPIRVVRQGTRVVEVSLRPVLSEPYTFGHLGKAVSHKNYEMVVEAFCNEFGPDDKVALKMKHRPTPDDRLYKVKDPRVEVLYADFTEEELTNWYHSIDCFVFPSHGEGDGLPTREAMSAGLPVILTDWSGLAEQCNPLYNFPLPIDGLIDRPDMPPYPDGQWAEPDFDALRGLMRYCYANRLEAREKGLNASEWIRNTWTWEKTTQELLQAVEETYAATRAQELV